MSATSRCDEEVAGAADSPTSVRGREANRPVAAVGTATVVESGMKTPTTDFYKLTREEALRCVNTVVFHEMFDLETGHIKEAYTKGKPPPPPTGTVVYEVGSGRAYTYVRGMSPVMVHPDSLGMAELRREAAEAAVTLASLSEQPMPSCRTDVPQKDEERMPPPSRLYGLQRVVPVSTPVHWRRYQIRPQRGDTAEQGETSQTFQPLSPSGDASPPQTAQTLMEKVLGWQTSTTPEPLESETEAAACSSQPLRPPTATKVAFDMCNCVALVTSNWLNVETDKPALAYSNTYLGGDQMEGDYMAAETKRLLDGSETLRHLRTGYRHYLVNNISEPVHRLSAYSCQSPSHRVYNAYKSITCKPAVQRPVSYCGGTAAGDDDLRTSDYFKQTLYIDQYLTVFSTLADFNYTLSFNRQYLFGGGLSNVLVVDKLWTYNSERRVFVPHYQMLPRDTYTETFVKEVRSLETRGGRHISHIRFLSTPNTALYTNRPSLTQRRSASRQLSSGDASGPAESRGSSGGDASTDPLPLKKRRLTSTNTFATRAYPLVLRLSNWPLVDHRPGCSHVAIVQPTEGPVSGGDPTVGTSSSGPNPPRPSPSVEPVWRARNPTLVAFKYSVNDNEPTTLLCNILVEMHLGSETRY